MIKPTQPTHRILMVDTATTWRGGQRQVLFLMRGLCAAGHEVFLAAPENGELYRRAADVVRGRFPLAPRGGNDVFAALRLRSLIKQTGCSVVHAHSSHAHGILFLASCPGGVDALRVVSRRVDFAVAKNPFGRWKYRFGADLYLAISKGVREVLTNGGIDPARVRLVPSGVDLEHLRQVVAHKDLHAEFRIPREHRIVGNVAALAPHKSQVDYVLAAKSICDRRDDITFLIVGEGELREMLSSLVDRLQLQGRVILTGFREDALSILKALDCFVLSSHLEGLGTSIMDAQALGVPVVATDTGGIPELVDNRVTGLLVPPRQPDTLAGAIEEILDNQPLRTQCVAAAQEKSKGYDYRETVYKTVQAYSEWLPSSRKGA